jgi:hypothetical protein
MNIKNLENCFDEATKQNKKYIGVKIKMQDFPRSEIIINERENFEKKLHYYQNAYSEDLSLKTSSGIRIVGFTYGDSFKDIEEDLM